MSDIDQIPQPSNDGHPLPSPTSSRVLVQPSEPTMGGLPKRTRRVRKELFFFLACVNLSLHGGMLYNYHQTAEVLWISGHVAFQSSYVQYGSEDGISSLENIASLTEGVETDVEQVSTGPDPLDVAVLTSSQRDRLNKSYMWAFSLFKTSDMVLGGLLVMIGDLFSRRSLNGVVGLVAIVSYIALLRTSHWGSSSDGLESSTPYRQNLLPLGLAATGQGVVINGFIYAAFPLASLFPHGAIPKTVRLMIISALCELAKGTPLLMNRYIRGAGSAFSTHRFNQLITALIIWTTIFCIIEFRGLPKGSHYSDREFLKLTGSFAETDRLDEVPAKGRVKPHIASIIHSFHAFIYRMRMMIIRSDQNHDNDRDVLQSPQNTTTITDMHSPLAAAHGDGLYRDPREDSISKSGTDTQWFTADSSNGFTYNNYCDHLNLDDSLEHPKSDNVYRHWVIYPPYALFVVMWIVLLYAMHTQNGDCLVHSMREAYGETSMPMKILDLMGSLAFIPSIVVGYLIDHKSSMVKPVMFSLLLCASLTSIIVATKKFIFLTIFTFYAYEGCLYGLFAAYLDELASPDVFGRLYGLPSVLTGSLYLMTIKTLNEFTLKDASIQDEEAMPTLDYSMQQTIILGLLLLQFPVWWKWVNCYHGADSIETAI